MDDNFDKSDYIKVFGQAAIKCETVEERNENNFGADTKEMKITNNCSIYKFINIKDIKIEKQDEFESSNKSNDIEECMNSISELLKRESETSQVKEEESDIESQIVAVYEHDPNTGAHTTCINPSIDDKKQIMQDICQLEDSPSTQPPLTPSSNGNVNNNKCTICGKYPRSLTHHMLVHTNVRKFICNVCNKAYKELPTLRRHMNTHLEKQYQCDICKKLFSEKSSLRRHLWTLHNFNNTNTVLQQNGRNNKFRCKECDKQFRFVTHFNAHVAKHGDPEFECNICKKVFAGRSHLRIHKRVHTKEKPFKCNFCNVAFSFKHVLKTHLRKKHLEFDTFQCYICFKSFHKKHDLRMHARTHLEVHAIKMGKKFYEKRFAMIVE